MLRPLLVHEAVPADDNVPDQPGRSPSAAGREHRARVSIDSGRGGCVSDTGQVIPFLFTCCCQSARLSHDSGLSGRPVGSPTRAVPCIRRDGFRSPRHTSREPSCYLARGTRPSPSGATVRGVRGEHGRNIRAPGSLFAASGVVGQFNNRERMDYAASKAENLTVGSGIVEATNKLLVTERRKGRT